MMVDRDAVLRLIQNNFVRGQVFVIGSGVSAGFGLPGMSDLAQAVVDRVGDRAKSLGQQDRWSPVEAELRSEAGLESALAKAELSDELLLAVSDAVTEAVSAAEAAALTTIVSSQPTALAQILHHMLRNDDVVDVVTTNYDRLVEVQAAVADIRVDTMFYGQVLGHFGKVESQHELLTPSRTPGRPGRPRVQQRPHIRLAKPHGSLDWFAQGSKLFRSDLPLTGSRRVVAPGGSKYRLGYEEPFDSHRARANEAIDGATAYLFAGYGFNDEHLQTHLRPRFATVPAVVTARTLTDNARAYVASSSRALGLERVVDGLTRAHFDGEVVELEGDLWSLDYLAAEVLT